ncbi:riboflavin kinase [Nocardia sp. NPDC127606]|uniref:riboflavin kinase n=1 Tax=Nocardia sp. NPDC127606 TaxID=3345406 RepID=UPI0036282433
MTIESHTNNLIAVVEGKVQHGDRRGRELGFPTANIHDPDAVRLDGVYAGILHVGPTDDGPSYVAAVSVGHRPTFYGANALRLLEAHLLDFSGDLYGRRVRIELHSRLRPQRKYVDDLTLVRQLRLDVEATRAWAFANGVGDLVGNNLRIRQGFRRTTATPSVRDRSSSKEA